MSEPNGLNFESAFTSQPLDLELVDEKRKINNNLRSIPKVYRNFHDLMHPQVKAYPVCMLYHFGIDAFPAL